ncbi:mRNA splicing protein prp28 [Coemansia sp. IMI 203386]|nr:mRNA splicing protein prp28 [Coemansia sp. IMI 203386]
MDFVSSSRRKQTRDTTPSDGEVDADQQSSAYVSPFATKRPEKQKDQEQTAALHGSVQKLRRSGQPLSVEEALRLRAQTTEPERPVFLTKAQRAQLALQRRQKQADAMRANREAEIASFGSNGGDRMSIDGDDDDNKSEAERRRTDRYQGASSRHSGRRARSRSRSRSPSRARGSERRRGRYHDRDEPRERSRDRRSSRYRSYRGRSRSRSRSKSRSRSPRPSLSTTATATAASDRFTLVGRLTSDGSGDRVLTDRERDAIRQRYLVGDHDSAASGRARRQSSRRVVFGWDAAEDTSRDISDLYEQRTEYRPRARHQGDALQLGNRSGADDRHWSKKQLSEMRDRDWRIFREDFSISCKGGGIPHPYRAWAESDIPQQILRAISDIGYAEPTPIQRQAIPVGLQRRDLIGIAETGSGKTASFLIPMLAHIMQLPPLTERRAADGPYALVLAPTRELAQQIDAEALKFARRLGFRSISVVGGHGIEAQAMALGRGAEIVIATPGRLRDCLERRVLVLNQCSLVVMDEADRMVDMGFEEDVNFILDALPSATAMDTDAAPRSHENVRHTTMFSATMPPAVERLARRYLRRPATVTIGTAGKAVDTVEQRVEFVVGDERRKTRLLAILSQHVRDGAKAIVFVNQKKNVDLLGAALGRTRHTVVTLHGGKSQDQREHALARLRAGDADVLVATDVAGRGIDVKDIALVVNFDMAKDIESYTHRIGRTGRAGNRGLAITFVNPADDRDVLYDLRKMLAASPLSRCPPELASHEAAQAPPSLIKNSRL